MLPIIQDYGVGYAINHRSFSEFNDMSLIARMNKDQQAFNSYIMPSSNDPDESWRWNGVRPVTRNKVVSIAAHMVSSILFPNVFAQNQEDEEDKAAAEVMRLLIEWNIRNSDYEVSMLFAVISALVNPVAYLEAGYGKFVQKIKEKNERGEITLKEVIDEVMSGFRAYVVPPDEMMIANPYQFDIQKQRFLIRQRFIDYDAAKAMFGSHKNFNYVQLGIRTLYDAATGLFYDQADQELSTLVEWVVYYNRLEDTEVSFINGIYLGEENVNANRIKHRDNMDRPKYCYAKFGYEPVDAKRFFFYKSLVAKMADDQDLIDEIWRSLTDVLYLNTRPPIFTTAGEELSSNVIFPSKVTNFGDERTKITPFNTGVDLLAGYKGLGEIERSMEQSSQANIREGQMSKGDQTAYEIRRAELNAAITQFGIFGRMIVQLVRDFGGLMVDDIIRFQSIPEIKEIVDGKLEMKFRSFLLPNQIEEGQNLTKKVIFDKEMIGRKVGKKEKLKRSYKILKEQGGIKGKKKIYYANPESFSRLRFQIFIDADALLTKSLGSETADKLSAYDKMIQDPNANQRAVSRDFLFGVFAPGNAEKYMMEETEEMPDELANLLATRGAKQGKKTGMPAQMPEQNELSGVLQK